MKNNEKVVLAAVQQIGHSLQWASEGMKNNEKVVLAAVQQNGLSLSHASEDMKNNAKVVLAAILSAEFSLEDASEDMRSRIQRCKQEFGCSDEEAARALAEPRVVQVSASRQSGSGGGYGEQALVVTCTNLAGENIATISLEPGSNQKDLRQQMAKALDIPPQVLQIIVPSGERLRDTELQMPLRELFGLA